MHDENMSKASAQELADAAHSITQKIVSELKDASSKADAAAPRLFFPNGIELIDVGVKVGLAEVKVKIAGAQGIKGGLIQASEVMMTTRHLRDASACDDIYVGPGLVIRWFNLTKHPITIRFTNGSPLENDLNNFPVPGHGGIVDTPLKQDLASGSIYPYHNPPVLCPLAGMPRIIIQ